MTLQRRFLGLALVVLGLAVALPAGALPNSLVPDASFTTLQGKVQTLGAYRHRKLMVWEVATWCGSCVAGLQAMQRHALELRMAGVTVILLQVYKNGGYPGLPMKDFVKHFAPALLDHPGWVIGTANADFSKIYNPKHYADIYYLIDADGKVAAIDSAPGSSFPTIKRFMTR
ncbi:MAG: TlpA family protein disulfide reductase [Gammaproteobacteria bacterium]